MALQITAVLDQPALIDLPWERSLEQWPEELLVALPRGISRHVVRFVRLGDRVYAIKEVTIELAEREYRMLRQLERLRLPSVEAVGIVAGRETPAGEPIDAALITRHLHFSLPYRGVLAGGVRPPTVKRLVDALAVLLVRLHLAGFFWGDCSLSNTLFRRDAGAFAAYLVDAETGELHPRLSDGQRGHDLELAHVNIFGELLDLQAGGMLPARTDPARLAGTAVQRYEELWDEVTRPEVVRSAERHLIDARFRRLNELGFDVAEVQIERDLAGDRVMVFPMVVDAGHHQRRLMTLTGLDVEANQARRLLNDLDAFRAGQGMEQEDEEIVAHRWLTEAFRPTVAQVPPQMRHKLEPAEIFHEVLDHRWYLSEAAGHDVGLGAAVRSYVDSVLTHRPDERTVLTDDSAPP